MFVDSAEDSIILLCQSKILKSIHLQPHSLSNKYTMAQDVLLKTVGLPPSFSFTHDRKFALAVFDVAVILSSQLRAAEGHS